jgi:hypothetical protein
MKALDLLKKGADIIGQRGEEYETTTGDGERSFNAISTAFNAITGKSITAAEVALMLQITKDVRQWSQDRLHEDSVIDCVNYAALKGEEIYKQYNHVFADKDNDFMRGNPNPNTRISLDEFFDLGFELVVGDEFIGTHGRVLVNSNAGVMCHSLDTARKNRFIHSLTWRETEYYANRANLIETRAEKWRPNLPMLIELYGEP